MVADEIERVNTSQINLSIKDRPQTSWFIPMTKKVQKVPLVLIIEYHEIYFTRNNVIGSSNSIYLGL